MLVTVTKPQPDSHKRRAIIICFPTPGPGMALLPFFFGKPGNFDVTGIVTLHPTRIFIGKIKHLRHTAEDNVERLLLKLGVALSHRRRRSVSAHQAD